MITKEEFEKAVNCCTSGDFGCCNCPLKEKLQDCCIYLTEYIKENEPAPAATDTSSEVVSKDTDNIHLDDSTLLDVCQEGLEKISKIALDDDYPDEFLTGYIVAVRDNIKRLRGGDGK